LAYSTNPGNMQLALGEFIESQPDAPKLPRVVEPKPAPAPPVATHELDPELEIQR
jgi:hypothetical protein